jgi:hypothetical protein
VLDGVTAHAADKSKGAYELLVSRCNRLMAVKQSGLETREVTLALRHARCVRQRALTLFHAALVQVEQTCKQLSRSFTVPETKCGRTAFIACNWSGWSGWFREWLWHDTPFLVKKHELLAGAQ